jgi:hypothetical protein
MRFYTIIIFSYILISCDNNAKIIENTSIIKDTLYISKYTDITKDGFHNIRRKFIHKIKTKKGFLPVNDTIICKFTYYNEMKELLKNVDFYLISRDSSLNIKKINNSKFMLFIKKGIINKDVKMDVYLSPHKNFVIKSIYDSLIIENNSMTGFYQYIQPVENW